MKQTVEIKKNGTRNYTGNGNGYLYTSCDWTLSNIKISAQSTLTQAQIAAGRESKLTLTLIAGSDSVSQTIDIGQERDYYKFDISINVPAFSTVTVRTDKQYCTGYYDVGTQYFAGGWISGSDFYDMTVDIEYTPTWTIDSQNDGYPHHPDYNVEDFTYFSKDENGYPRNWGVWKLDTNNERYPWIVDPENWLVPGDPIKVSDGKLQRGIAFIYDGENIVMGYAKIAEKESDSG